VGSVAKPVGTHLVNLAKQQLESMLVVLKEYEDEEKCEAQVLVRPFVRLSVRLSVCPSVRLYVCTNVHLSVRPSVSLYVRPSVRLSVLYCLTNSNTKSVDCLGLKGHVLYLEVHVNVSLFGYVN
jgi:hypothetical protein